MNKPDETTIRELVDRLYAAGNRMGQKNSNRKLMFDAMSAIMELSLKISQPEPNPPRVELAVPRVTLQ